MAECAVCLFEAASRAPGGARPDGSYSPSGSSRRSRRGPRNCSARRGVTSRFVTAEAPALLLVPVVDVGVVLLVGRRCGAAQDTVGPELPRGLHRSGEWPLVLVTPGVGSHHEDLDRRFVHQSGVVVAQPVIEPPQLEVGHRVLAGDRCRRKSQSEIQLTKRNRQRTQEVRGGKWSVLTAEAMRCQPVVAWRVGPGVESAVGSFESVEAVLGMEGAGTSRVLAADFTNSPRSANSRAAGEKSSRVLLRVVNSQLVPGRGGLVSSANQLVKHQLPLANLRWISTRTGSSCDFSNSVSNRASWTWGNAWCLTRCPARVVSPSCPLSAGPIADDQAPLAHAHAVRRQSDSIRRSATVYSEPVCVTG